MKTRFLTVAFLIIVFSLAVVNLTTDLSSIKPAVKYALGRDVPGVESMKDAINEVESEYNDDFVTKYAFIEVNGAAKSLLGNWESNERIKIGDGYLVQESDSIDVSSNASSVVALNDWLASENTPFLYIAFPNKVETGSDELRPGRKTHSNENVDRLLEGLEAGGVRYYDLRADYGESHDDWQSGFFRTDHHWLPQTAFWAYTDIAGRLHEDYGYSLDSQSMDIGNYDIITYEKQFLGSAGRRTGRSFSGLDDFSVLIPNFDTSISVDSVDKDVHLEGSFEDVMFQKKYLEKDYYNIDTYSVYNGDYDICIEKNESAANDMTVVVVKDSYTLALQPYYSFMFSEVHLVDLRYIEGETLADYIDRIQPDLVIMEYSPGQLTESSLFEFGL